MDIKIKRAYEDAARSDGYRVLVDRIWPRGISKEKAALDDWIKALAPSTELRKWFNHDPGLWDDFRGRYRAELDANADAQTAITDLRRRAEKGPVTLVFAAHDSEHSNAAFLQQLIGKS